MWFRRKFFPNQEISVNNLMHYKLIISNIIIKWNIAINGILLNGVLILNFLNNLLASCLLINLDYFLPLTVKFDVSINLFCLVFLTIIFVCSIFFTTETISFHCFHSIVVYSTTFSGFFISLYSPNMLFTQSKFSWY